MNWIKRLVNKASVNSNGRKIQLEFLAIIFTITIGLIGYQFYQSRLSLELTLVILAISIAVGIVIYFKPFILKPVLWIWLFFGLILGEFTSSIVLGIVYFLIFSPITYIVRTLKGEKGSVQPKWTYRESDTIDYTTLY